MAGTVADITERQRVDERLRQTQRMEAMGQLAGIFGITDSRNSPAPAGLAPVVVGMLVVLIGATFGFNSGYAINPARDFGPRLFTFVAGWGGEVFRAGNNWWWVPIVAPSVGGVLGGWVYDVLVGSRFASRQSTPEITQRALSTTL